VSKGLATIPSTADDSSPMVLVLPGFAADFGFLSSIMTTRLAP
jgi:hypothetical protein